MKSKIQKFFSKFITDNKRLVDIDWDKFREESEERARNVKIPDHIVCRAIELKPGDVIIHNYSKLKILKCGCGFGAVNEFGDYFWIKGVFMSDDNCLLQDFWSYQACPVIKLL